MIHISVPILLLKEESFLRFDLKSTEQILKNFCIQEAGTILTHRLSLYHVFSGKLCKAKLDGHSFLC